MLGLSLLKLFTKSLHGVQAVLNDSWVLNLVASWSRGNIKKGTIQEYQKAKDSLRSPEPGALGSQLQKPSHSPLT